MEAAARSPTATVGGHVPLFGMQDMPHGTLRTHISKTNLYDTHPTAPIAAPRRRPPRFVWLESFPAPPLEADARVLREARAFRSEAHGPHGLLLLVDGVLALLRVDGVWAYPTAKGSWVLQGEALRDAPGLVWIYRA